VITGSRIGQYRVLALLGEGGMGKVLLVEHAVIGTRHALKMLHDEMSNNDMIVQRFLNEARAAGTIGHRNVVEISHVDRVEGGGPWYLVMRYLEGQTLAKFLASRAAPIDQRLIVHVIGEALNGLQAAHDRRIIHRDLKPDNFFLTTVKGDPYRTVLLDFGVAQLGHDAGLVTRTGAVIGTPQYMAPEQHRGASIDHRADLWAIGAIVYEMATGRFPYQGDASDPAFLTGPEIFHRMMSRAVVDPRRFNPALTAGFAKVILKALEVDPGRRPHSARELAVALAEATPRDRGAPSGIEVLSLYADELLQGGTPVPPIQSSSSALRVVPASAGAAERRDPQSPTQVMVPGAPMSTLGASASQVSAAVRPARNLRRLLVVGLCLAPVGIVLGVIAARHDSSDATPARAGATDAASLASATIPSLDARVADAELPDAPSPDARPDAAIPPDAPPPPPVDAGVPNAAAPSDAAPPRPIDAGVRDAGTTAPQSAPPETGRLRVVILPWAEVWVDGKPLGQTPVHTKLSVGAHRVRLKNDTKDKTVTVTVTAAKTTVIDETW
jgi:serine/threonine-protein kinase